jgi:anti-anti-sigma factor
MASNWHLHQDDGILVLSLVDDLDLESAPALASVPLNGIDLVVADCRNVRFLDSRGVAALIQLYHRLAVTGGELRLVVTPESMPDRVLRMAEIDSLVPLFANLDDAVAGVS